MANLIGGYDIDSEEGRLDIEKEFERRFHTNNNIHRELQENINVNWFYIIGLLCLLIMAGGLLRKYL